MMLVDPYKFLTRVMAVMVFIAGIINLIFWFLVGDAGNLFFFGFCILVGLFCWYLHDAADAIADWWEPEEE